MLLAVPVLQSCTGGPGLSDRLAGSGRVRGDADTVTVRGMGSRLDALPLAIGHCAHFGRSAQFAGRVEGGHRFRCVAGA